LGQLHARWCGWRGLRKKHGNLHYREFFACKGNGQGGEQRCYCSSCTPLACGLSPRVQGRASWSARGGIWTMGLFPRMQGRALLLILHSPTLPALLLSEQRRARWSALPCSGGITLASGSHLRSTALYCAQRAYTRAGSGAAFPASPLFYFRTKFCLKNYGFFFSGFGANNTPPTHL